ncbi:MAG: phenylalanine 4-monooxygenase [Deltaproteobacteria bacterium]|nr:phenylalanine 4-monooxygenase [Deltaproteobacteria bacterium]
MHSKAVMRVDPIVTGTDFMTHLVELPPTHPGFADPAYRERRDAIATLARRWRPGQPLPRAPYSADEHAVWRGLWAELSAAHAELACPELLACERTIALPSHRIPQLAEVEARLIAATGFRLAPVAGLVSARAFFTRLAAGHFMSTQYVRHASRPRYTPEPDVIHELVGHAASLAHPGVAAVSRRFGQVACVADEPGLIRLARVYWFTLEFGLCETPDGVRAVGAGLLSSVGELRGIESGPQLCSWDLETIASTAFDTQRFQDRLFVGPRFPAMLRALSDWLDAEESRARQLGPRTVLSHSA